MSENQIRYEPSDDERLSEAVVAAISQQENRSPLEVDPLFEYVDLGALDRVFDAAGGVSTVAFSTSKHRVTVTPRCVQVEAECGT